MLENMFIGWPPGNYDRILDFSTPVTGSLFFIPTSTFLESITPDQPAPAASFAQKPVPVAAQAAKDVPSATAKNGSLGIGSLKGEVFNE